MIKSKIEGDKLFLSYIPHEVGRTLHNVRNSPEIRDWCRQTGLIDDNQQKNWLEKISEDPSIRMYAICLENKVLGICGLTDIDHLNQRAEFSLYIFPAEQRKGYAKSALKALFDHGFSELNLNTIWGETFAGNPAMKLFQSIGMQMEGKRRNFYFKNGKFIDAFLVSITREEFQNASD